MSLHPLEAIASQAEAHGCALPSPLKGRDEAAEQVRATFFDLAKQIRAAAASLPQLVREADEPNEHGVTPLDEAMVEDWKNGLLQTVTVVKSADRHADLHARQFAAAHEVAVASGDLGEVLGAAVECLPTLGTGRYTILVDWPHERDGGS